MCYNVVVLKRMQIMVPEEVYKLLREEAFNLHTSISKLIVQKLSGPIQLDDHAEHLKVYTEASKKLPKDPFQKQMEKDILAHQTFLNTKNIKLNKVGEIVKVTNELLKSKPKTKMLVRTADEIGSPRGELDIDNYT